MPKIANKIPIKETRTISKDNITILNENDIGKKDSVLKFKVKLLEGDVAGKNGRRYSISEIKSVLPELQRKQRNRELIGELDHPTGDDDDRFASIYVKEQSHLITDIYLDGNVVYGVIETLNTPNGRMVRDLILQNVVLGLSLRGFGEVSESVDRDSYGNPIYDINGLEILTWDIVSNPQYDITNFTIANLIENQVKTKSNKRQLAKMVEQILEDKYKINLSKYNVNLNELIETVLSQLKEQESNRQFTRGIINSIIHFLKEYKPTFIDNILSENAIAEITAALDEVEEQAYNEFVNIFDSDMSDTLKSTVYQNLVQNDNFDEQIFADIKQNIGFLYDILLEDLENEILVTFIGTDMDNKLYSKLKEVLITSFNNQILFQNATNENYKLGEFDGLYNKIIKFLRDVFGMIRNEYDNIEDFETRYGQYSKFTEVKNKIMITMKSHEQKILNILDSYIQNQIFTIIQEVLDYIF